MPEALSQSCDVSRIEKAYAENYIEAQYCWVQFFTEHLVDVSRQFGGDLQIVLILALVGQRLLEKHRGEQPESVSPDDPVGINASRIADITCIPRQTVRRKLQTLAGHGWIHQKSDGSWAMTIDELGSPAARDLSDLDLRSIRRIAKLTAQLWRLSCQSERSVERDGAQNERPRNDKPINFS